MPQGMWKVSTRCNNRQRDGQRAINLKVGTYTEWRI